MAALPTIKKLYEQDAKIILASHLGRPKGERESIALTCSSVRKARFARFVSNDCIGTEVEEAINGLQGGQIVLLENLRFHKGETENDPQFAKDLHLQMSM